MFIHYLLCVGMHTCTQIIRLIANAFTHRAILPAQTVLFLKHIIRTGLVVHTCNLSTWEAVAGVMRPQQHSETISEK